MARKSECTAQCGHGYRTLEIYCAKISHGKTQKIDGRFCSGQHKPEDKESCHGDCNPGGWEYSPWSEVRLWHNVTMSAFRLPKSIHQFGVPVTLFVICSAPRAVVEALATAVQFVERQLSLAVMTANAAKGINLPSNPAMSSSVHSGRLENGPRSATYL